MRSTITIDDDLFKKAARVSGDTNISTVVTDALNSYVRAAAAKRLIALGGSAPNLQLPSGNRYDPELSSSSLKVAEEKAVFDA